ncbi:hypothetical protein MBLNU459_g1468t2 [Dothideomycetes sp. NU459]
MHVDRVLTKTRGEIATRIIAAARELEINTYALYTDDDASHTYNAADTVKLASASSYLDVSELVDIVRRYDIDAVHPGYGFLSESAEFVRRVRDETGAIVVGPGEEILDRTGDKLQARRLAEECNVPILPALTTATSELSTVEAFARDIGFPIMIKAVDGGGGRGIRLVNNAGDLASLMSRAIEESPSRQVFAEKAAVKGFRHIEVQIVGDAHGNTTHLWERECSIQRRYQKVIEMAPSSVGNRALIATVIEAALRMARKIQYVSLGTFEFLVNAETSTYYFLEINPRLQVEHTVTESICGTDLVQAQIGIAQGLSLDEVGLGSVPRDPKTPPAACSLQLRITAEDAEKNWSLSVGKIQSFHFPSGNGVRTDTNLISGATAVIGADFDSLVAKLVITAPKWETVVRKARRAVEDTRITGVQTNLAILCAILAREDFVAGDYDTQWLEGAQPQLIEAARRTQDSRRPTTQLFTAQAASSVASLSLASSSILFRKDDAWSLTLQPMGGGGGGAGGDRPQAGSSDHHLQITKVLRNNFPESMAAEIAFTPRGSSSRPYTLQLKSTSASASAMNSRHRKGSPGDPRHVIVPFSGRLVELLVDVGESVRAGDVICVVKQMKMELEVRASKAGVLSYVIDAEDGEDLAEGMLAAIVEEPRVEAKL